MAAESGNSLDRFYTFFKTNAQDSRFLVLYWVNLNQRYIFHHKYEDVPQYNYFWVQQKLLIPCKTEISFILWPRIGRLNFESNIRFFNEVFSENELLQVLSEFYRWFFQILLLTDRLDVALCFSFLEKRKSVVFICTLSPISSLFDLKHWPPKPPSISVETQMEQ